MITTKETIYHRPSETKVPKSILSRVDDSGKEETRSVWGTGLKNDT